MTIINSSAGKRCLADTVFPSLNASALATYALDGMNVNNRSSHNFLSKSFVSMLISTSRGILRTLILLSLFILAPTLASAATYYVAPSGNDANPGTQTSPWRTIKKAAATLVAGDTAILLNGTYTEPSIEFRKNGTESERITFKAQNKWQAIVSSTSGCNPAFAVYASYITIEDIRFSVSPGNIECPRFTSWNLSIWLFPSAAGGATISHGPSPLHDSIVRGVYIDHSLERECGIKSNQDFSIIENSAVRDAVELFNCNACVVRGNTLYDGTVGGKFYIVAKGGARNAQIYNNVVHMTTSGTAIIIGGVSCDNCHWDTATNIEAYNTIAYNNVVLNETSGTIMAYHFRGAKDSAFINNVSVGDNRIAMGLGGHNVGPQAPTSNPTFKNNIFVGKGSGSPAKGYEWLHTGTLTMDHNNFYNVTGIPPQTHAITGNPLLTSDWHLKTGSPAIDSGVVASMPAYGGGTIYVSKDKDGVTRTAPWDLGIYNVGGGTSSDATPPTVSITAPASGSTVSGTAVTVSANASDNVGVGGVQFKLDGANLGAEDITAPYSVTWNSTTAAVGSHTLTAVARDAAGNTTTSAGISVTVPDATSPTVSIIAPANGATVSGTTVAVSATAADNVGVAGVQFRLDGANYGAEDTATPYSVTWNSTTATVGSHTLTAVARDAAGNTTTSAGVSVTVPDATSPTVSIIAPANGATVSGTTLAVSATAADNVGVAGVQFRLDGANYGAEDTAAPYSVTWDTTTAANGSHTLTALARDAAGNITTSTGVSVTVSNDTTPPTVSITAPANGGTVSGAAVTISANAYDNVGVTGVQFKLDGVNLGAEDITNSYSLTWNTTATNGTHTLSAVARDAVGNTTTSAGVSVTVSNVASCAQTPLNVSAAFSDGGFAYLIARPFGTPADISLTGPNSTQSTLRLFEGSLELGPAHSLHADIRNLGQGRFSHWSSTTGTGEALRFAASNNTDPRTNGRSYTYCVSGTPPSDTTAPSVPTGLTGVASASQVSLSWKASTDNVGVTGYRVYRNGTQIAGPASNSHIDGNLVPGTYSYTVTAIDATGNVSTQSGSVSATIASPPPPTSCTQTPLNVSAASSDGGFAYKVNGSFGTPADNTNFPTQSTLRLFEGSLELGPAHSAHPNIRNLGQGRFSHKSSTTGTQEALRFAASNNTSPRTNGRSYTYCVSGTPPSDTTAPSVPTGLTGVYSASQVSLSWKASTDNVGVTGYRVYRNGTQIAGPASNSHIDGNLVPGTYSYTVAAIDATGNVSEQSGSVSVTVLLAPSHLRLSLLSHMSFDAAAEEKT